MPFLLDHKTIRYLKDHPELTHHHFSEKKETFLLNWSSFWGSLEKEELIQEFSFCERGDALFQATITSLLEIQEESDLFYLYDSLFSSCLQKVYSLPWLQLGSFIQEIVDQKKKKKGTWEENLLESYEKAFRTEGPSKIHDFILSFAWDRFCLLSATLFDFPSQERRFLKNLAKFRDCLIDSYHHIRDQRKSSPSFFRLVNALFYYEVREERIDLHQPQEWEILTQSFPLLLSDDEISSCSYIDFFMQEGKGEKVQILTVDSLEVVQRKKALSSLFLQKIGIEDHPLFSIDFAKFVISL